MAELRRTHVGDFKEDETLKTLQDVNDAYHYWKEDDDPTPLRDCVQPMEKAASHLKKIVVRDSAVDALCHGADLAAGGILQYSEDIKKDETLAVMTLKGELVAAGKSVATSNEMERAEKGIMVDIKKVFMEPGTYPMMWK